jgi:hypothetical protein
MIERLSIYLKRKVRFEKIFAKSFLILDLTEGLKKNKIKKDYKNQIKL